VILRFGHTHLGRLPGRNYNSLGRYLDEFAAEHELNSFQINIQLINQPGVYWSLTEYPEYGPLSRVGDRKTWLIVDLRPARAALKAGELSASDKLKQMVFDYDAVLLLGGGSKGRRL